MEFAIFSVKKAPRTVLPLTFIHLKRFSDLYSWEATFENANPKGLETEGRLKQYLLLFLNLIIFVI